MCRCNGGDESLEQPYLDSATRFPADATSALRNLEHSSNETFDRPYRYSPLTCRFSFSASDA